MSRDVADGTPFEPVPEARYWQQVRNGMWMCAAPFASIFCVDTLIRDHYQAYFTF